MRLAKMTSAALLLSMACVPAYAQATRTWVSGVGDDANPCSRTAPCKTFAGAISKAAVAGKINCVSPVDYELSDKAALIDCDDSGEGTLKVKFGSAAKAWVIIVPGLKEIGKLGFSVAVTPGDFGTLDVAFARASKSDDTHGILKKKWDQREIVSMRFFATEEGLQPTAVKRTVEQKPPIGPWKLVAENTDVPVELISSVPKILN